MADPTPRADISSPNEYIARATINGLLSEIVRRRARIRESYEVAESASYRAAYERCLAVYNQCVDVCREALKLTTPTPRADAPQAGFACPICGRATSHSVHSHARIPPGYGMYLELQAYQRGEIAAKTGNDFIPFRCQTVGHRPLAPAYSADTDTAWLQCLDCEYRRATPVNPSKGPLMSLIQSDFDQAHLRSQPRADAPEVLTQDEASELVEDLADRIPIRMLSPILTSHAALLVRNAELRRRLEADDYDEALRKMTEQKIALESRIAALEADARRPGPSPEMNARLDEMRARFLAKELTTEYCVENFTHLLSDALRLRALLRSTDTGEANGF